MPRVPDDVRRWIYTIGVTLLPLLVAYGVIKVADEPLWAALIAAVMTGIPSGVARANWTRTDNAEVTNGVVTYQAEPGDGTDNA